MKPWQAREMGRAALDMAAQVQANDEGRPHPLNGYCYGERSNPQSKDGNTCMSPLTAGIAHGDFKHVKDGDIYVACPLLSCPRYDIPRSPEGTTIRLPPHHT